MLVPPPPEPSDKLPRPYAAEYAAARIAPDVVLAKGAAARAMRAVQLAGAHGRPPAPSTVALATACRHRDQAFAHAERVVRCLTSATAAAKLDDYERAEYARRRAHHYARRAEVDADKAEAAMQLRPPEQQECEAA